MFKKIYFLFFVLCLFSSCSFLSFKKESNSDLFVKFIAREQYMKEEEPSRVFNPDSAMLITTLPDKIGDLKSIGKINDFEIMYNGLGYSKRYKNKKIKKGYWIDVFTYHSRQEKISSNINNQIVKAVYNSSKKDVMKLYKNAKIIDENLLIFTAPNGKILKMKEFAFNYWNPVDDVEMKSYIYFGTNLNSFYKIRVTYKNEFDNTLYKDKENFVNDLAYYYTDGMSLSDFNKFKKNKIENPIKVERREIK